jgi:hypothetical protein
VHRSVWMEVETLRRANVASLREKYREVLGEETRCRQRGGQTAQWRSFRSAVKTLLSLESNAEVAIC